MRTFNKILLGRERRWVTVALNLLFFLSVLDVAPVLKIFNKSVFVSKAF
jgi:hypothetical protein